MVSNEAKVINYFQFNRRILFFSTQLFFHDVLDIIHWNFRIHLQNFIRRCLTYQKEIRPDVLTLSQDDYLKPPVMKSRFKFIKLYLENNSQII